ncbi:VWA domain-containing protein [Nocardioides alcanivorans]|uniref:VWA domain-containing protein n=1 Tax=Nocardioides alcanivorans TaxID=2897352 RepID=UPI001F2C9F4E|nr:VWA domain-containing protein [Nocardioides alcanivorans]
MQQLAGSRVAVIVFDDDARLAVPFTTDVTTLAAFWETVGWRPSAKASGSDVSVAAELAEHVLRRAAEERPDHERYVVYVGDGEQTAEAAPASFAPVQELVSGALVLGYGTPSGGRMTVSDDSDEPIRIDGKVQLSKIDESALKAIAEQVGGEYAHRAAAGDLPELVASGPTETATETVPGDEYYWIVAVVAVGGLLWLLWVSVAGLRSAREELADGHGS